MIPSIHYDLVGDDYRALAGVSKSMLDDFAKCPAWYYQMQIVKSVKSEKSPALQYGTLLHSLVLDGEAKFHAKPDGMSFASKEGKEWRAAHSDAPIISEEEANTLQKTANLILTHPIASKLFAKGRSEVSMFGVHNETGMTIKGRADWINDNMIVDIKTTQDASNKGLSKSISNFGYHRQAWLYLELAKQNGLNLDQFVFIAIEKGSVPLINVRSLSQAAIEQGGIEINSMLFDLNKCIKSGIWKDYSGDEIAEIDLPPWAYSDTTGMELIGAIPSEEINETDLIP